MKLILKLLLAVIVAFTSSPAGLGMARAPGARVSDCPRPGHIPIIKFGSPVWHAGHTFLLISTSACPGGGPFYRVDRRFGFARLPPAGSEAAPSSAWSGVFLGSSSVRVFWAILCALIAAILLGMLLIVPAAYAGGAASSRGQQAPLLAGGFF